MDFLQKLSPFNDPDDVYGGVFSNILCVIKSPRVNYYLFITIVNKIIVL